MNLTEENVKYILDGGLFSELSDIAAIVHTIDLYEVLYSLKSDGYSDFVVDLINKVDGLCRNLDLIPHY